ncbi:MAG: hypothetical protein A2Z95_06055 [Gallionellales bacterium GWA2_60_18]|nr:MAG: hypothetical protein A2Z95_06055 [Gallionellales bacterium GWA2_60_18]
MQTDLKNDIRNALAGSSSQQPVDVAALYPLGTRKAVQAALLELYRDSEVYCCLYTRRGNETSVWWAVGGVSAGHSFRCGRGAAT